MLESDKSIEHGGNTEECQVISAKPCDSPFSLILITWVILFPNDLSVLTASKHKLQFEHLLASKSNSLVNCSYP